MRHSLFSSTLWLSLLAVITGSIATYDYHVNPTGWYDLALFCVPITCGLTIVLWRRIGVDFDPQPTPETWQPIPAWQWVSCLIGLVCFGILAQLHTPNKFTTHHFIQFLVWLCGLGFIIAGVTGGISLSSLSQMIRKWLRETDTRWLLLIVFIGLILRSVALQSSIPHYVDEVHFAQGVFVLRTDSNIKIMGFINSIANFSWVYVYGQYLYTEIFGSDLATLRAFSAIVGTLTIAPIYLLCRWMFNNKLALVVAFMFAVDLPHLHFSRIALNNIADPLFGVLAIAFLWRGLQTHSWRIIAIGGVCLGITSYFYEGGRLLYLGLIFGWLFAYVLIHRGQVFRRGIGMFVLAFVLVASGYYLPLRQIGSDMVAPRLASQRISDGYQDSLLRETNSNPITRYLDERITPAYMHIVSRPDGSFFYYSPYDALVLPYALPFMFIGLGITLYYWRRGGLIFLFWILLTVLGNSLLRTNNWSPRFVVIFPALVVLTGLGYWTVYQGISLGLPQSAQKYFRRVCLLIFLLIGFGQIYYYFGMMLPDYNVVYRTKIDDQDAMRRAQDLPPDTEAYILPIVETYHEFIYLIQDYEQHHVPVQIMSVDRFDFAEFEPDLTRPYVFFIEEGDIDTRISLRFMFGNDLLGPDASPNPVPEEFQFVQYTYIPDAD